MAHAGFRFRVEQLQMDRVAGEGLEGQRSDELGGGLGHDHADLGTGVLQLPGQFSAFVGGDAAGDAKQNAAVG